MKTVIADGPFLSHSSGLNSFENLWKLLKERIRAGDPSLVYASKDEASLQCLRNTVTDIWDEVEQSLVDDPIKGRLRRSQAVVDAQNRRTKC